MNTIRNAISLSVTLLGLVFLTATISWATAAPTTYDPTNQTQSLLHDEAQTVYLGNLARQAEGVPPLRWNLQLTHASRWFSWDSVENRPEPYCGHQDTNGEWPGDRARHFGYLGGAGAENAFCGYVTPQQAIEGWLNSPGHRANLLAEGHREIGLGYYWQEGNGRGYVAQKFGHDAVYAPVIIEHEAISTQSQNVNLYIYDRSTGGGFAGLAPATEIMVSNDQCFTNGTWEPYAANKAWALTNGDGWKSVYVKSRDEFGRTMTVADSIYLGANAPLDELGHEQMSSTQSQVTLYGLDAGSWPRVQFSLGWLADDTYGTFGKLWGNGEPVDDTAAWGGTAYRLFSGDGESSAWVYDTGFIKDTPLIAYFRLKVNDNSSPNPVGRVTIQAGGTEYGPLVLNGTDFTAANQYQEFAVPFTFHDTDEPFLIFQFWRSGAADVYVDAVSIFSIPQPISPTMTWDVPGGNYRGQGVWVRYSNEAGTQFSAMSDGVTAQPALQATPSAVNLLAVQGGSPPNLVPITVSQLCGNVAWQVAADADWLETAVSGSTISLQANQTGLANGVYHANVTITAVENPQITPLTIPVQLTIVETLHHTYLPLIRR